MKYILDMADVSSELSKLWVLSETIKHEVEVAEAGLNPETSTIDLGNALALIDVFRDRFHDLYEQVVRESGKAPVPDSVRLDSDIPY